MAARNFSCVSPFFFVFIYFDRLSSDEYAQLMCNFVEIVEIHEDLLLNIEDCNDRVGKLFLSKASVIKNSHQAYCAAHPRAIVILDKYK